MLRATILFGFLVGASHQAAPEECSTKVDVPSSSPATDGLALLQHRTQVQIGEDASPTLPLADEKRAPTPAAPLSGLKSCSFEADYKQYLCGWWKQVPWQDKGDDFQWSKRAGGTPSKGTGPDQAHSGGQYLYIEVTSKDPGEKAIITTTTGNLKDGAFLHFWYHMYGSTMGSLTLTATSLEVPVEVLWQKSGNQGDDWHIAKVDLSKYAGSSVQLNFTGIKGGSKYGDYKGDASLDDVTLWHGGGPAPTSAPKPLVRYLSKRLKTSFYCEAKSTSLGRQSSLHACAEIAGKSNATYFAYGKSCKSGRCYIKWTAGPNCPEGSSSNRFYDLYQVVRVPVSMKPEPFSHVKSDVECISDDTSLGNADTAQECANLVKQSGGKFFIFGKGDKEGRCFQELTAAATCPEGFEKDDYDFYKLLGTDAPQGSTPAPPQGSTPTPAPAPVPTQPAPTTPPTCNEALVGDGAAYRGCQSKTRSGKTCQEWTSQSPHRHKLTPQKSPGKGLANNYCRNPDGEPTIWCYTTAKKKRWEFCDPKPVGGPSPVPSPAPAPKPGSTCNEALVGDGADYRGCQSKTRSGKTCQKWTSQRPHRHKLTPQKSPGKGLGDNNYCRNPDGEPTIWCYTTDKKKRWEFCDPTSSASLRQESSFDAA